MAQIFANNSGQDSSAMQRILKSYRSKIKRYTDPDSGFSLETVMGCTRDEFKAHLESKFEEGMSWDNYGDWWVANRETPSNYDLTDMDQFLSYFNFESFTPMWREQVKSPFSRQGDQGLPQLKNKNK